jgi:hypothetical protein
VQMLHYETVRWWLLSEMFMFAGTLHYTATGVPCTVMYSTMHWWRNW